MSRLGHYEVHFWCSKLELKLLITKYYQQHFYPNCMSQLPTITPFSAQFEFGAIFGAAELPALHHADLQSKRINASGDASDDSWATTTTQN